MQTFKITTRWDSYTHYFVDAVNEEEARQKVFGGEYWREYHDPTYGEVEEEVYEIVAINGHTYEEDNNE